MLFGIFMRLIGASIETVIAYKLLGGAAEDAFTVLALMFLVVWPQEWVIEAIRKMKRKVKRCERIKNTTCQCRRSA